MLLSDLEQSGENEAFGVVCDIECFFPPAGLKVVSFICKMDGDRLDRDFLDVVIAFKSADVAVTVDVPFDQLRHADAILRRLTPLQVDIVLLPPENSRDMPAYCEALYPFAKALKTHTAYAGLMHPVSDAMASIMVAHMSQKPPRLEGTLSERLEQVFQAQDRSVILDAVIAHFVEIYGDAENLEAHCAEALGMVYAIGKSWIEDYLKEQESQIRGQDAAAQVPS